MENKNEINKTVNLDLTTIDSNIFAIFGAFSDRRDVRSGHNKGN